LKPCPFCQRIDAGEYDTRNEHAVSFEPLNPVTPGHLLVVPLRHVADAIQVPSVTAETMRLAAILAGQRDEDCNLITSIGPAATQTVQHLHIHIVPRREGDGLALPWTGQRKSDS
jgi:histidine triad (HIT) family protein